MNQAREQRKQTLRQRATELSRDIRFLETDIPQQQTMINMLKTNPANIAGGGLYDIDAGLENIQEDRNTLAGKKRERKQIADELKAISREETPDDDFSLGSNMGSVSPRMGSFGVNNRIQQMPLQRRRTNLQRLLFPENQHHQQPLHQAQFRTPEQFLQLAGRIDDEEEKEEE